MFFDTSLMYILLRELLGHILSRHEQCTHKLDEIFHVNNSLGEFSQLFLCHFIPYNYWFITPK